MTTPEQTNERSGTGGDADGTLEPDATEGGRPIIRPGPPGDPEPTSDRGSGSTPAEANPEDPEGGRPIIRPGPPGG